MMDPQIAFQIDFNVAQVPAALGLPIPPAARAAMLGITEQEYLAYCEAVAQQVQETARRLLTETEIVRALSHWDLARGSKIMTIGDSITTYRYGYAELLRALLALTPPADEITLLNLGQSGYTSTHAREVTFTQFLAIQADWVLVMYGVNDCKQFGGTEARTLVSLREYAENMRAVVRAFYGQNAQIILLTPTPVVESLTNTLPDFQAMQMTWDNRHIAACADEIRALGREFELPCVDLMRVFGINPDPALYLPDGLHPNFAGQQLIVREVLRTVGQSSSRRANHRSKEVL